MSKEEPIDYCQRCAKRKEADQKKLCDSCFDDIVELCKSMESGARSATALAAEFGIDLGALARRA